MRNGQLIGSNVVVEWAVRTLEWACAAGIPVVNTGDGFKPENMSDEDAFKLYEDRMAQILEACERTHTRIAIEPHGTFSLTGDGLVRLLSYSTSPWLGVNYDACNIYRAAYVENKEGNAARSVQLEKTEDEVAVLKRVVNRVFPVHAKDVRDGHCVALSDGNVNVAGCIEVLKQVGYNGAISLETEGDEPFEVSVEYAKKGYEFLNAHL